MSLDNTKLRPIGKLKANTSFLYPSSRNTTTKEVLMNNNSKNNRSTSTVSSQNYRFKRIKNKSSVITSNNIVLSILLFVGLSCYVILRMTTTNDDHYTQTDTDTIITTNTSANATVVLSTKRSADNNEIRTKPSLLLRKKVNTNTTIVYNYSILPPYRTDLYPIQDTLLITFTSNQSNINTIQPLTIRIILRPDFSFESVQYIKTITTNKSCQNCKFYRSEKPGILQGIISSGRQRNNNNNNELIVPVPTKRGLCPVGYGYEHVKNDCPEWDKHCSCHGPVMVQGTVAFAAGDTGPDFFINNYKQPALWWGTQHTVWGHIVDTNSFAVLNDIFTYTAAEHDGMTFLQSPIHFTLSLESKRL